MLSFEQLRRPSSEDEKRGESGNLKTKEGCATPIDDLDIEVCGNKSDSDSNFRERLLQDILHKVSGLDNMCKKVDHISKRVINIERKVEALDTRIKDLEQVFDLVSWRQNSSS